MRACARAGTRARALAPLRCILVCAFMFAYCAYDGVSRYGGTHAHDAHDARNAHNEHMLGRHWSDCDCARACLRSMCDLYQFVHVHVNKCACGCMCICML